MGSKQTWSVPKKVIFKQRFQLVHFVADVLYSHDQHINCSAGTAAVLNLGIDKVQKDFGHAIVNQMAIGLVNSLHRHGG